MTPPTTADLAAAYQQLADGHYSDPHGILGAHPSSARTTIRAFRPHAESVAAVIAGTSHPLVKVHDAGIFAGVVPGTDVPDYVLAVTYAGETHEYDDPYRYLPTVGDVDLHLFGEGRHEQLWQRLGAHVRRYGSVTGVSFAVWAPNARGVRVAGEFNYWESQAYPMRSLGGSGVWELFVPRVGVGTAYKFEILGADGTWRQKADPMAFYAEVPPSTASVVYESAYSWNDAEWLRRRAEQSPYTSPMSVYEVHLGSWRQGLSYRELADQLTAYLVETAFTHVQFLPVAEHPFGGSWGYQVSAYYAPTSRFGTPDEFRHLVDVLHQAGIGVILDWVPAHFPRDEFALARFDGTALYEHEDPRLGSHPDWGTLVFNFERNEVRNFLVANALYWIEEMHVDCLRVDAVASMLYLDYSRKAGEWLPNKFGGRENLAAVQFLQEMNATVYRRNAGAMTIAEESTSWPGVSRPTHLGGLGFGFKWNMGWMHDTLDYLAREPVYRQFHHHQLTFSMMYAYTENFVLPISHDEVVHGKGSLLRKMPGDRWKQLANVRALLAYMWAHPGKQLLFMGQEFAQDAEWSDSRSLDWWLLDLPEHRGVHTLVRDLNGVYRATSALFTQDVSPEGFQWIDANDAVSNVFTFLRWGDDGSVVACIANFSGMPHSNYRVGLPFAGRWRELINTDAEAYGGAGRGNYGEVQAIDAPWHGRPASVELTLPDLATLWITYEP